MEMRMCVFMTYWEYARFDGSRSAATYFAELQSAPPSASVAQILDRTSPSTR